jgi:hypothetical protein
LLKNRGRDEIGVFNWIELIILEMKGRLWGRPRKLLRGFELEILTEHS